MKKLVSIALILLMLFSMAACSKTETETKTEAEPKESATAPAEPSDAELQQLLAGSWEVTLDIGQFDNWEKERQLREFHNGAFDNSANKDEYYEMLTSYPKYPEGSYLVDYTLQIDDAGKYSRIFTEQELQQLTDASDRFFIKWQEYQCELLDIPYSPTPDHNTKVRDMVEAMKSSSGTYEIIDRILYINQLEYGTITFDGDKMVIDPTETSFNRIQMVYTRTD